MSPSAAIAKVVDRSARRVARPNQLTQPSPSAYRGETPCLSDGAEPVRAGLRHPSEGPPVHRNQAELRSVPERPLKVVEEGPVEVAAHIDTIVEACDNFSESGVNVADALRIVIRRDPVFGNEDRRAARALPGASDGVAKRRRVELLAKLGDLVCLAGKTFTPLDMRAARALRSESIAGVGLHSNEVVVARQLEEAVADARVELNLALARLGTVLVLKVGQRKGHAHRDVRPRADRRSSQAMGVQHIVDDPPHPVDIPFSSGWVDADDESTLAQPLGFVDGAGIGNLVAQRCRGAVAVAFEEVRKFIEEESAALLQPAGKCEVMERHDRHDPVLPAGGKNSAVMVERGVRELIFLRLDPGPLDAEAECIEAEPSHQRDVLAIPVVKVASVARRLHARRPWAVLPIPPVAVGIAALDLMRRRCGAEEETVRKLLHS